MSMSDRIFGSYTVQNRNRIRRIVSQIDSSSIKDKYASMSDEELKKMTQIFKDRISKGETLDDVMVDAIAVCREVTKRQLGMFHYNVQVEAAVAMHDNVVAEMKTGEGKTLVQILSAYLNALEGKSVHVITSNDYLAGRDMDQNKKVYSALGLSCGNIRPKVEMPNLEDRRREYNCDIVYGTASTIAFDYLDDNKVDSADKRVNLGGYGYAIIDEVDSILLDDGSTPLIKAVALKVPEGQKEDYYTNVYAWACDYVESNGLSCEEYDKEKFFRDHEEEIESQMLTNGKKHKPARLFHDTQVVELSSTLESKIYKSLYPNKKWEDLTKTEREDYNFRLGTIRKYMLARFHYKSGTDYTLRPDKKSKDGVQNYKVEIIGESTGRVLTGRRYMGGLHELIEAKEAYIAKKEGRPYTVKIKNPTVTTAKCTYPDFFSKYENGICGMTGTSNQEDFMNIYGLPTYEVPSRKTNMRVDEQDEVYATKEQKYNAIIEEVMKCRETLQPVLIGVTSVEESLLVSKLLKEAGIRHSVLNAEQSENEASIISTAGLLGKVTIATNMAGRGTDIKLGEGVAEVGGLYVIGTTKNRNERIDNQLKGRAGRQGDPGKTKFFSSLEDNYVLRRGGDKLLSIIHGLSDLKGIVGKKGEVVANTILKMVGRCQKSQESEDQAARKKYEKVGQVLSIQKNGVYEFRNHVLDSKDVTSVIRDQMSRYVDEVVSRYSDEEIDSNLGHLIDTESIKDIRDPKKKAGAIKSELDQKLGKVNMDKQYQADMRKKMLDIIDDYWVSQMEWLDDLQVGSDNQVYAGKDPIKYYEETATLQFRDMIDSVRNEIIAYALNPTLKYGEYTIPNSSVVDTPYDDLDYGRGM